MVRYLYFAYGAFCHVLFLAVFGYMLGFVGNFIVPKSIDSPSTALPISALLNNMFWLCLFAVQHSLMARPEFKRYWMKLVPQPIERSTYVLLSCIALAALMVCWQGIPLKVWDIRTPVLRNLVWFLFAAGWLLVPFTTLLISHFDLFGTRQVWLHMKSQPYTQLPFREPSLYRHMRHPLYVGWMIAFWSAPTMTVGHLLFASVMTGYMMLAVVLEERDLANHFGHEYRDYQRRVPMFIPVFSRHTGNRFRG